MGGNKHSGQRGSQEMRLGCRQGKALVSMDPPCPQSPWEGKSPEQGARALTFVLTEPRGNRALSACAQQAQPRAALLIPGQLRSGAVRLPEELRGGGGSGTLRPSGSRGSQGWKGLLART